MKFGAVNNPEDIDFSLPDDHSKSLKIYSKEIQKPNIYIGCAKWGRKDLKNFYPRGTKDELAYYSTQFNSIELNATFYRMFPPEQFAKWKEKTPEDFRFFPKINQDISHMKRLNNAERLVDEYVHAVSQLEKKLGMVFLQMHQNFAPKDFDRAVSFVKYWPKEIPLAIEFRHPNWYNDASITTELFDLLEKHKITNILVDSAGRRDLLHMRLTTPTTFIRYVGANHTSDYTRLDDWVERIKKWIDQGIHNIYFFVHQNEEIESPKLSAYFIKQLNDKLGYDLKVPELLS
ncbi:MAG: DUF72 domain-containing protein [Bacteroidales bacterium]|nr:DUF72 domain-containing protein [Bacteroidales bacterium]